MTGGHRFARTTCACPDCVEPCRRQPGPLAPGDLERIVVHAGLEPEQVPLLFWASPGAVLGDRATGRVFRVGTVTPQLVAGRCVFLQPDDRCGIHAVAPFGCAYFDTHQTRDECDRRGVWLYGAIAADGDYRQLRENLPPATTWRPA